MNNGYNNSYSFDDGLSSTQGSDLGYNDPSPNTTTSNWMPSNVYGTIGSRGPPPPVAPKPTRVVAVPPHGGMHSFNHMHHLGGTATTTSGDLNGSRTSLRSGSTLRNVTQV